MAKIRSRYSIVAIILHWLIALLILGQIAGGLYMTRLPDEAALLKFEIYQLHKSFGVTIFTLTVLRLLWRLTNRPPALPASMPGWEKAAARASHVGFYVLLLTIPLAGWAVVSASPLAGSVPTYLFGAIPLPHLPFFEGVADRKTLAESIAQLHRYMAFTTVGLLTLHVGAALKHHLIDKDNVLAGMAPLFRRRS